MRLSVSILPAFLNITDAQRATITGSAIPWLPPETFHPELFGYESDRPTPQGDIYSFACVCTEVSIHIFSYDPLGLMHETVIHGWGSLVRNLTLHYSNQSRQRWTASATQISRHRAHHARWFMANRRGMLGVWCFETPTSKWSCSTFQRGCGCCLTSHP